MIALIVTDPINYLWYATLVAHKVFKESDDGLSVSSAIRSGTSTSGEKCLLNFFTES